MESKETAGQKRRLGVGEDERAAAQRVGLQRRPSLQIWRCCNHNQFPAGQVNGAGDTSGVNRIPVGSTGQRVAQGTGDSVGRVATTMVAA